MPPDTPLPRALTISDLSRYDPPRGSASRQRNSKLAALPAGNVPSGKSGATHSVVGWRGTFATGAPLAAGGGGVASDSTGAGALDGATIAALLAVALGAGGLGNSRERFRYNPA